MKLGVTLEKALQETSLELDLTEFNFFTTSIVLQRETGGNLSEILNNLSEVLRGRFIMAMKINVHCRVSFNDFRNKIKGFFIGNDT